jgi:hypothetical protein
MSREIPTLRDIVLKTIARYPSKCMTEEGVQKLLEALKRGQFPDEDMVQVVIDVIIESGRMADEAVPVAIYKDRITIHLANSKISGEFAACLGGCVQYLIR